MPSPRAANAAAPSPSARTSESQRLGSGTEKSRRPIAIMQTELTANAISVAARTAAMYVDAGNGVARTRFKIPDSRRITMKMARPAKAVDTRP